MHYPNRRQQAAIKSKEQAKIMQENGFFIMNLIPKNEPKYLYPYGHRINVNPISVGESEQHIGAMSYRKYMIWANPPSDKDGPLRVSKFKSDGETIEEDGYTYPAAGMWQGWYWSFEISQAEKLGWRCDALEGVYWSNTTPNIMESSLKSDELISLMQAESRMISYARQ